MNKNNLPPTDEFNRSLTDLFYRFLFLRKRRFQKLLPPNLAKIRSEFTKANLNTKMVDLLYLFNVMVSHENEPVSMGEVSQLLEVPMSTATRIVDWLVHNELAVRLAHPDDRRVVLIQPTETGRDVYRSINDFIKIRVEQVFSPFTQEERQQLSALVKKLISTLEEEF